MNFPGASHTFGVWRKVVTTQGFNKVNGGFVQQSSGIAINLRPMNGQLANGEAGIIATGQYEGATNKANDIRIGDLLKDEAENDKNGNPVTYEVQAADHNFAFLQMVIHRTQTS